MTGNMDNILSKNTGIQMPHILQGRGTNTPLASHPITLPPYSPYNLAESFIPKPEKDANNSVDYVKIRGTQPTIKNISYIYILYIQSIIKVFNLKLLLPPVQMLNSPSAVQSQLVVRSAIPLSSTKSVHCRVVCTMKSCCVSVWLVVHWRFRRV